MDSRKKKGIIGGVVIFLAATMLIGGTLTWTDFTQSKTNRFRGSVYYDATLHDDFDGENKDVYVENSGENTIYVRVRLDEYMQIGNINMNGQDVTKKNSVTSTDKEQWIPHKYVQDESGDIADCTAVSGDGTIRFHGYYEWNMSGAKIKYDPGTPGVVSSVLDGFKKDAGGKTMKDAYGNKIPAVDPEEGAKETLEATTPVTMKQYVDLTNAENLVDDVSKALLDGIQKGCWILDGDGWAYWSQPLEPGTATNLLLDEVNLVGKTPADDWYYAIDVKLQAVSLNETETTWNTSGGYTENAKMLIASWNSAN